MTKEFWTASGECYQNSDSELVGIGHDSRVYKLREGVVKKVYVGPGEGYMPPTAEKLALYFDITNKADELSQNGELAFALPFSKEKYIFKVIPFLKMYECNSCGHIEAETEFIPGHNLSESASQFDKRELNVILKKVGFVLQDKLGVVGISLDVRNVKSPEKGLIVITDLCANISDLKKKRV